MKTAQLLLATTGVALVMLAGTPAAAQSVGAGVNAAKVEADRDKTLLTADSDDGAAATDVVVTGTRIVRPNNKTAAPVTTVTTADIRAQGATTIEEVLNRLPQVQPNAEQNYADSEGRQRIKLRSLGFERTLTLVDGLRLGIQNGLDVSIIPTALVERIDVLSGGASSVYGSDAVSGVVNFILKKNFDGIDLTGNYSFYNHRNSAGPVTDAAARAFFPARTGWVNDGGRVDVTLSAGKNLFGNRINLTGFVNYRQSDLVPLAARSYSSCEVTQTTRDGPLTCSLASFTPVGTIIPQSGAANGQRFVNDPTGSGRFVFLNSGPGTAANPYDGISFQRRFERINAGGFLTAKISDDIELYSTALWYRDKSTNPQLNRTLNFGFYGSQPYLVNCDNPFLSAQQAQIICGARAGTSATAPIDLRYRFDGLPPYDVSIVNKGVRVTAGLRGRVLNDVWSYDIVGVYAKNEATFRDQPIPDFTRLSRSLRVVNRNGVPTCQSVVDGTDPACVPFNAFTPYFTSQALSDYISYSPFGQLRTSPLMWQAVSSLSGDLGKYGITSPLAEQGVAIAFGAEFRAERLTSVGDAAYRLANGGTDTRFTQNVWEVNTEVQAPLVEDQRWTKLLQLNAGYRQSKYNRLDSTFGTWKVEGLWAPIADITLRASFNKAQAAPTVTQADQASTIRYVTIGSRNDPCASTPAPTPQNPNAVAAPTATIDQCRRTGLPDNLYGSTTLSCPDGACTIRNGGFGLTPETAYTKTFGVLLRPRFIPGLTVSVDRFLIDLNQSINYFAAADFLNGCLATGLDYYCRGVVRNPGSFTLSSPASSNPSTGYIAQGTSNGFKSKSHGWDFQGQYDLGLGSIGRLDLSFNGSLATLVGSQDSPDVAQRNCAGYYGPFCGESLPKWRHTLRTSWTSFDKVVNISLNWRHTGPMTLSYNADAATTGIPVTAADRRATYGGIAAYDYFDLSTAFTIAKQFTFRVSVNNLFDRDPPLLPNSRSVLGLLRSNTLFGYDQLGRQIVVGGSVRF